jgi:DNA-binding transcriptional LysR family regulator
VAGFLAADHVAVAEKEFPEDPVDTWLREQSRSRRIAALVPSYLQALHLVAHTDLVAVIPERLVRACADSLGLRSFDVALDVGTFDEYLLHPTRSETDAGCSWFRGVVERGSGLGPLETPRAPAPAGALVLSASRCGCGGRRSARHDLAQPPLS